MTSFYNKPFYISCTNNRASLPSYGKDLKQQQVSARKKSIENSLRD